MVCRKKDPELIVESFLNAFQEAKQEFFSLHITHGNQASAELSNIIQNGNSTNAFAFALESKLNAIAKALYTVEQNNLTNEAIEKLESQLKITNPKEAGFSLRSTPCYNSYEIAMDGIMVDLAICVGNSGFKTGRLISCAARVIWEEHLAKREYENCINEY